MCTASHETVRKSVIAIAPINASVCAAFFDCGRRNALTPFEIDSTPVKAADPDANARRSTRTVIVPAPAVTGWEAWAVGHEPAAHLAIPTATTANSERTNPYVGSANRNPA